MVSSFVASITMDISPWIPCGLAIGSVILCLFVIALMPIIREHATSSRTSSVVKPANEAGPSPSLPATSSNSNSIHGLSSALFNRNMLFTVPIFLVGIFRYAMLNILIQYASVRFGLKISTGATFYTETAIVNIGLFLFLIPRLTAFIRQKYSVRPDIIDLFLVRTSVTLMCIGCLAIGLAQTSHILPIGTPFFHTNLHS